MAPSTYSSATMAPSTSSSATMAPSTSSSATMAPSTSSSATMVPSTSSSATMAPSTSSSTLSDPSEFTLISSDNRKFFIPSTSASLSEVIKRKLGDKVWPKNVVVLQNYDGMALEAVAEYLRGNGQAGNGVEQEMKRRFNSEFLSGDDLSVDVLFNAGQDLEIPGLVDLVSEKISGRGAGRVSNRAVEWVSRSFKEDLTSDEEIEGADQREELPIPVPTEEPDQGWRRSRNLLLLLLIRGIAFNLIVGA